MANRTKFTAIKREEFCRVLAGGDSVTAAAESVGLSRRAAYNAREADPDFAAEWDAAVEAGTDRLEDEAKRRGLDKSDTLLIFLLKGRRREKYGDKVEHGGKDGGPIEVKKYVVEVIGGSGAEGNTNPG
jgi:hypothetical protein